MLGYWHKDLDRGLVLPVCIKGTHRTNRGDRGGEAMSWAKNHRLPPREERIRTAMPVNVICKYSLSSFHFDGRPSLK